MALLPDILRRPIVFWGLESGHRWSADRIRSKLSIGSNDFAAEAEHLTEAELGTEEQYPGDDEDAHVEWQIRAQSVENHQRMLERTESYLWGLGIAGIYHQFERDVREVIAAFTKPRLETIRLQGANFKFLCDCLEKLGYPIRQSEGFDSLNVARLISNAIKHGEGPGFIELADRRPDLFPGHQAIARHQKPGTRPDTEDLRVGPLEFDQTVSAISMIWPELEEAISPAAGRT
jgi:hypothetical protein